MVPILAQEKAQQLPGGRRQYHDAGVTVLRVRKGFGLEVGISANFSTQMLLRVASKELISNCQSAARLNTLL